MGQQTKTQIATTGVNAPLVLTAVPAGAEALLGKPLLGAGALTVAGTYECEFETAGLSKVEAVLMPSQLAGTFAPSIVSLYLNRGKPRQTTAGVNFVVSTIQTLAIAALAGEQYCKVKFTIPGGGSITFTDTTVASVDGTHPPAVAPTAQAEYLGQKA